MNELPVQQRKAILLVLSLLLLSLVLGWFKRNMEPVCGCLLDLNAQMSLSPGLIGTSKENLANLSISINTSDAEALSCLPGIGRVKADRIISYRQEHGKFKSKNELINVKGIGLKTFEKLKDHISVK